MSADLLQLVDLTVPEADGIRGFAEVNQDGQHYVPLIESDGPCELCPHEVELLDDEDEVVVEDRQTYRIAAAHATVDLCREHLQEQPTTLDVVEPEGGA